MYVIKWLHYDNVTEEPKENLINCQRALQLWKKKKKREVLVKDMQKQLPLPKLLPQPTQQYRSRQLYMHNFGIYFSSQRQMHCYTWTEYDGKKESDEICSVLWKSLQSICDPNLHLITWSDNCVSQNQCWMILFFHAWLILAGYFKTCTLKFFLKGHTFTIADLFFGNIEQKSRIHSCEKPEDYHDIMRSVGCIPIPVDQSLFFDWKFLKESFKKKRFLTYFLLICNYN